MRNILVHFEVAEHFILLETFISSAKAAEIAVNSINKFYFSGKLDFDLVVLPPNSGTLKQYIGVVLKIGGITYAGLWSLIQLMDSSSVQAISKELTGKIPSEIVIEKIRELSESQVNEVGQSMQVDAEDSALIEEIVVESVRAALEKPRDEISRSNLPEEMKYEIELAQAEMFGAALADSEVRGIGFTEGDEFPIHRNQFAERAVRPRPPKRPEDDLPDWRVGQILVRITSPNFERSDQPGRKWKAKDVDGVTVLFEIEDEQFWQRMTRHEFKFTDSTMLEIQLATRFVDNRPKEHKAIRVLRVDRVKVAKPLDDDAIAAIVGKFSKNENRQQTPDLFDDI